MLYSKENKESYLEPVFGSSAEDRDIPKYTLGKNHSNLGLLTV